MGGSVDRVKQHLASIGFPTEFREFDTSTKNSTLAALALGCSVSEIAKSVVFKGGGAFVVVISGDRRVDAGKLATLAGAEVAVASPEDVREMTGYPIGGVPPFPHRPGVRVFADSSLRRFEHVWAASGEPSTVFRIRTRDLLKELGNAVDVAEVV